MPTQATTVRYLAVPLDLHPVSTLRGAAAVPAAQRSIEGAGRRVR